MGRVWRWAGIGILVGVVGVGVGRHPFVRFGAVVGTGYAAKQLCSAVFLHGRDPGAVFVAEVRDRVFPLGGVMAWEVDREAGSVEVRVPFVAATAVHRSGHGCTLVVQETIAGLRADAPLVEPVRLDASAPWPRGGAGVDLSREEIDYEALSTALDRAFANPSERRTHAVLVAFDGSLVAERYADGFDATTRLHGWSVTKSLMALVTGHLVHEGKLRLDAPVSWPGVLEPNDARDRITVEHLLRMRSGLAFEETYAPGDDATAMLYLHGDMASYAASRPIAHPPGEKYAYSSGSTVILSRLIQDRLGGSLAASHHALARSFFGPLRITSAVIEPDEVGTWVGGSYGHMTGRDWLRLGQLMLDDGVVEGRRLLPEGYVRFCTTKTPGAPQGGYGAGFWLNVERDPSGRLHRPSWPMDAYYAAGHDGQFVVMIPSHRLVVARFGFTPEGVDSGIDRLVRDAMAAVPTHREDASRAGIPP